MSTAADDMNERKDEGRIDSDSFEKLSINDNENSNKLNICVYCSKPAENKCGACGIMYCSHDCQKKDWKEHKKVCQKQISSTTTTATATATAAATTDPSSTPPVQFYDSLLEFLAQIVGNNKQTNLTFSSSPDQPNLMYMAITENMKTDYFSLSPNKKLSANAVSKQVIMLAKKGSPPMVTLIVRKIVSQSNPNPPTHHRRNHHHAYDEHYFVSSYFMIFEATRVVVHKSSPEETSVCLNTDSQTGEPMPIPDDETYE
jgi:hypothetical protein